MINYACTHTIACIQKVYAQNIIHNYKLFTALLFFFFVCGVHNHMSE